RRDRRRAGRHAAARRAPRGAGPLPGAAQPPRPRPAGPPLQRGRLRPIHRGRRRPLGRLRVQGASPHPPGPLRLRDAPPGGGGPLMSQPLGDFDELRGLLDALCEETITPEQVARLEELVLRHPEAEAFYVQYMALYADLARHFSAPATTEQSLL